MEVHCEAHRRAMVRRMWLCVSEVHVTNMWDGGRKSSAAYNNYCSTVLMHSNRGVTKTTCKGELRIMFV